MTTAYSATPAALVGRQPIFDQRLRVYAYELLFRTMDEGELATAPRGDRCSARVVVNTFMAIGLDHVVGQARAFINVDRDFLMSDLVHQLPSDRVTLEILEDVPPDPEVIATLRALKVAGYTLALDDFVYRRELDPMLELASIVKLELTPGGRASLPATVRQLRAAGNLQLVIERVETHEDLGFCRDLGFDLFQGFFLAKPATVRRPLGQNAGRLTAVQTLALLADPNATTDQLEVAISRDAALSYRLLRVVNSAASATTRRIDSLRQAIVFLGRDKIRSWVSLLILNGLSDKPAALMTSGLVRARMCGQLAAEVDPSQAPAYFTAGLLSILDAVFDTPMDQLVDSLPLTPEVSDALVGRLGLLGTVLDLAIAAERCEWKHDHGLPVSDGQLQTAHLEAIRWAGQVEEAAKC